MRRPARLWQSAGCGGGCPERAVAVGVEFGEFVVDVDGVRAVEVHVRVVGGPDVDGSSLSIWRPSLRRVSTARPWYSVAGLRRPACCLGRAALPDRTRDRPKTRGQRTFEVLPRRWLVERTRAWLYRSRRLDRDYERLTAHSEAVVTWALIGLMARRRAPPRGRRPCQAAPAAT
jgi:transposase